MMNGDVKSSCDDLTSSTDDKEGTGIENDNMDTKLSHTKALSTNHCDNSNSSIRIQVKSESAAQPDNDLTENNTCNTSDQTETNNVDNIDESSTCKVKDSTDSNASDDIQPKSESNEQSSDGETQDNLPESDDDAKQKTDDKSKQPAVGESPQNSPKSDAQQQSPDGDIQNGDQDSNHQTDKKIPDEEPKKSTNNYVVKDQCAENSKESKTSVKSKKQNNCGKRCNIPIQKDPYFREVILDEDSELDFEEECDQDSELDDEDDVEEAVSINSESDIENIDSSSQDSQNKSDIVIIDDNKDVRNGNSSRNMSSPEIHEITSDMDDDDDCVLDEDNISDKFKDHKGKMVNNDQQEHNGDNSDIEEVEMNNKATEKIKANTTSNSTPKITTDTQKKNDINDIHQAIAARGITVTPCNAKATQQKNVPQQQDILPSLTDDMFVVEAPSFIVPYVYEKPSMKPFREFVDKLGREIEEKQLQEEKERLEKEKEEKERKEKERQEKRDRGEPVSEDEVKENLESPKKEPQKKGRSRRRNQEDDDVSWDGSTSSDSEDEGLSDDNKMEVIKEKDDSIEEIKDVANLSQKNVIPSVADNYFDCTLGRFFTDIGMNLVQEYVQNDLIKTQTRKLSREKKYGHNTKAVQSSINSLMKNLELSKASNAPFNFEYIKCEFCSFRTESKLIMANHLETPHMRNNLHRCNFCPFEVKGAHDILFHMEVTHNIKGKLERAPAYHQCVNCHFEDSGKGKLARHQIACAKRFKPAFNLGPAHDWEPPAKIPKLTKARNTVDYNAMARGQVINVPIRGNMNQMIPGANVLKNKPRGPIPRAMPQLNRAPNILRGSSVMHGMGIPATKITAGGSKSQPSLSITPLPRAPAPIQTSSALQAKGTFVICEICDGYIKDLEQLRNHMQWIHKVKIHPKMIFNRPPLNCQKCQFRFFTDQGLERHLLGAHGLITNSMQEAANKGKDAGRCPVCGKVYQWKLLNHVARDHNLTLKPAHLSYKCTVCTATFGMYKLFENHVYSAHRVVAKKATDKPPAKEAALPKPLKLNDEITIIPQANSAVKRK